MKLSILLFALLFHLSANAQLIVDDFSTGTMETRFFSKKDNRKIYLESSSIAGNIRMIHPEVGYNPSGRSLQINVKNGEMGINFPYNTRGMVKLGYGFDTSGKNYMKLDLRRYKKLKIAFKAKSTVNGVNVTFWGKRSAATYGSTAKAWEGPFVFEVSLKDMKGSDTIDWGEVYKLYFQIDARSKTGCNMGIDKIWFE